MIAQVQEALEKAAELLAGKEYPEVLLKLESVEFSDMSAEDYGYYCLLCAEASMQLGRFDVRGLIDDAVDFHRSHSDTERFAWAKLLQGRLLSSLGRHIDAIEAFLEANAHYVRYGCKSGSARTLNLMSYPHMQMGSIDLAVRNLQKSAALCQEIEHQDKAMVALMNLAYVLLMAGRLKDAANQYSDIQAIVLQRDHRNRLVHCFMSALPYALKGDITSARKTIAKCKPYLDDYVSEKGIYFENLGLIELLDGNYKASEKAFKAGLKIGLEIRPESALVVQIKRLLGDLYLATRKFKQAEKIAREALAVAEKIPQRVEIAACYRVFAQVEVHRGNDDKAREWYKKAIDLFNQIGSTYELAVTRYLVGVSGLCDNGELMALLYLAREYFEGEDVAPYVKKIDAHMKAHSQPSRAGAVSDRACPVIIAENPAMEKLVRLAEEVAISKMTVLLTGETGTGKDHLSRHIHHHSGRGGKFVSVNAAAIPGEMIEAELFGHTKGAYTGAVSERNGLFQEAANGTLLLNEIADSSSEFQAKLLEVLETRSVRKLGEDESRSVDFRLIAATNHDLKEAVNDNRFRLDLYHRLNQIPIHLPPLSDRTEDIPALVEHFLIENKCDTSRDGTASKIKRLSHLFALRDWPGNVRELAARIEKLWLLSGNDLDRLIELVRSEKPENELERLLQVLEQTGWNRRETARRLGIDEATVRRRINKYDLLKQSTQ